MEVFTSHKKPQVTLKSLHLDIPQRGIWSTTTIKYFKKRKVDCSNTAVQESHTQPWRPTQILPGYHTDRAPSSGACRHCILQMQRYYTPSFPVTTSDLGGLETSKSLRRGTGFLFIFFSLHSFPHVCSLQRSFPSRTAQKQNKKKTKNTHTHSLEMIIWSFAVGSVRWFTFTFIHTHPWVSSGADVDSLLHVWVCWAHEPRTDTLKRN